MSGTEIPLLGILFLPFLFAPFAPLLCRFFGKRAAPFLALVPLFVFLFFLPFFFPISEGKAIQASLAWAPLYGVDLSFYIDGLSLFFVTLIALIGSFIFLYADGYLRQHPHRGRFFSFMSLFMGAMLGLVTADNLITLFVFWELTSLSSFLLIGFDHERAAARRGALQALLVTGMGGLALLAAFLFLAQASGSFALSVILKEKDLLTHLPFADGLFILILLAAFTKSAQFPFHFWLPNAMEAPTPVSAYLHSATMVKGGVYLLLRLFPLFGTLPLWAVLLPLFGSATFLVGTLLALRQTDLKLTLAHTTVASLGLLVFLIGIGTPAALAASVFYLLAHALFKAPLFMVVGCLDHAVGNRDLRHLGGIGRLLPVLWGAALLAGLSMAGVPPLFGFVAKEMVYAASEGIGVVWGARGEIGALTLLVFGNALMVAAAGLVALTPFWGAVPSELLKSQGSPSEKALFLHKPGFCLSLGPVVLALLGVVSAGSLPFLTFWVLLPVLRTLLSGGSEAVALALPSLHALPTHLSTPLFLSGLTLLLGGIFYWKHTLLRSLIGALLTAIGWGPDRGFDQFLRVLLRASSAVTSRVQAGVMSVYMTVTCLFILLCLFIPPFLFQKFPALPSWPHYKLHEWALFGIAAIGLLTVVSAKTRLTAIVSLGIQGFAVALIFMEFGAPDLSFTQFMVETLSVFVLALVMTRLNLGARDARPGPRRLWDAALAIAIGSGFSFLLLSVIQFPLDMRLSEFFTQYSATLAHGRNIVNVILVDFRALDTLGEITVVLTAGIAALALLRIKKMHQEHQGQEENWTTVKETTTRDCTPSAAESGYLLEQKREGGAACKP